MVITGPPASGKDTVMNYFLKHETARVLNIQKVITNTDRKIREGEPPDAYHFISPRDLDRMDKNGELVEQIVQTGVSRKATSKAEIERLFLGENLIWRIDPSLAAMITTGKFFKKHFPKHSETLMENTLVVCINAPKDVLELRRKKREGKNYDRKNFALRDEYEAPHLDILQRKAIVIDNLENHLTETVEVLAQSVKTHHAKIKNKKSETVVLVGGCFDIIHYGHIHFLKNAKALGTHLVVALESDKNIKRLKGKGRPIHDQGKRREMLESLNFVDEVIILGDKMLDKDYDAMVKKVHPQVIAVTKGDSILDKKQKQAKAVSAVVVEIPKIKSPSTSQIAKLLKIE